jgi:6-phosphogluconolactonase (cycloisomerase 2 family)
MKSKLSVPSVLVGLCCIGILTAGYMPDDLPLVFVESYGHQTEVRPRGVARLSPSGKHVYHLVNSTIFKFQRDSNTGKLTAIGSEHDDAMDGDVEGSCIASDGSYLFTSATTTDALDVVRSFSRDEETGNLVRVPVARERVLPAPELTHIRAIVVSRCGKHVYATSLSEHLLLVFARRDGELHLEQVFQDDDSPQVSFNGKKLPPWIKGAQVVDGLLLPASLLISPDDRFIYVGAAQEGCLTVFERDAATGRLQQIQRMTSHYKDENGKLWSGRTEMNLHGARELAFCPRAEYIYSVCNGGVGIFRRDQESGEVSLVGTVSGFHDSIPSLHMACAIVVSKSGKHVFVASHGDKFSHRGAITIFTRDQVTGELEFLKVVDRKEVAGVRHLSLSPDGRHLYASTSFQTLVAFAVNEDAQPIPADADASNSVEQSLE